MQLQLLSKEQTARQVRSLTWLLFLFYVWVGRVNWTRVLEAFLPGNSLDQQAREKTVEVMGVNTVLYSL